MRGGLFRNEVSENIDAVIEVVVAFKDVVDDGLSNEMKATRRPLFYRLYSHYTTLSVLEYISCSSSLLSTIPQPCAKLGGPVSPSLKV